MPLSTLRARLLDNWGYKLLALLLSALLYLFVRGDLREPSEEPGPTGSVGHGSH
jgi:hypothetical protein